MVGCYAQIASASCYLGFERHHQATNDLRHVTYILILLKTLQLKCENPSKIHLIKVIWNNNCVNLAWSMESGVWNSIPSLGFSSKKDINKHVWYSISSLVFNPNVDFGSQVWYWQ